jgi:RHS repeat-associated protein
VDNSGNVLARYTRTTNVDEVLSEFRSATASYYVQDGGASVTSLSNASGALANTYIYDSFGKLTASTGTVTNPFQYAGRELDQETDSYYYRARYFDQNSGRFISEDPIGNEDGMNFYAYVGNNPTNYFDPSGLCKEPNRFWNCVKNYYGLGSGTARAVTIVAALPLKKSWVNLPRALGSGGWTNVASWIGLGGGTAASGTNLARMGGRIAGPIAIGGVVIDAAALAMCEADYVPQFIYTIAKYDPF